MQSYRTPRSNKVDHRDAEALFRNGTQQWVRASSALNPLDLSLNRIASDYDGVLFQVEIHFRTDPKFGEVDTRFDRKARISNQMSLVLGFQAVHVSAGAVVVFSNVVTGSMDEEIAEASFGDIASSHAVDLPPLNLL